MQTKKLTHEELQKNIPDLEGKSENEYLYHEGYVYYSYSGSGGGRDAAGWTSGGERFVRAKEDGSEITSFSKTYETSSSTASSSHYYSYSVPELGDDGYVHFEIRHERSNDWNEDETSWIRYKVKADGVSDLYDSKREFLEEAAQQEDAQAQYDLGKTYFSNSLGENDYEKAFYWYEKAAQQDHAEAQSALGSMYSRGDYVEKNMETAAQWYEKAALQDDDNAQFRLGEIYENGEGVPKDDAKAIYWYEKRAQQRNGAVGAERRIGMIYKNGGVGVAQDYEKAVYWLEKSANGYPGHWAAFELARMYEHGDGVEQDYKKAMKFYWDAFSTNQYTDFYAEAQESWHRVWRIVEEMEKAEH
jgi:hypothetical protein